MRGMGGKVSILSGLVGDVTHSGSVYVDADSEVLVSGGALGYAFRTELGSNVEIVGGEFRLNGADFTGSRITLQPDDVFTGTLADGSSFIFTPSSGDEFQEVQISRVAIPTPDQTPLVVNSPFTAFPSGIRPGQTLTLQAGGELSNNFAVVNATLNIEGGFVGSGLEVYNGEVNISGGSVGSDFAGFTHAYTDFRHGLNAIKSRVNVTGGLLGDESFAGPGSVVNITGGDVGLRFTAGHSSEVNISGGSFGQDFTAEVGSNVQIIGGEFRLNGVEYKNDRITLGSDDTFTGTLADGSSFVFSGLGDYLQTVALTQSSLPAVDVTHRIVSSPVVAGPSGLRRGQVMTLQSGGVLPDSFAVVDATLNVIGGEIGDGLEASGATVNIIAGYVGREFDAYNSVVNISGGNVDHGLRAYPPHGGEHDRWNGG